VFWAAAQRACSTLDLVALRVVANTPAQFGAASEQIVRQRSHAVVAVADPIYLNERVKLQEVMQATRLPVACGWREHVVAGGLLSYAPDLAATARHVATYVDVLSQDSVDSIVLETGDRRAQPQSTAPQRRSLPRAPGSRSLALDAKPPF
jgi:hypothetical protein